MVTVIGQCWSQNGQNIGKWIGLNSIKIYILRWGGTAVSSFYHSCLELLELETFFKAASQCYHKQIDAYATQLSVILCITLELCMGTNMRKMYYKCVKYMCNHLSCKMHVKLHELVLVACSMQLCVKHPYLIHIIFLYECVFVRVCVRCLQGAGLIDS